MRKILSILFIVLISGPAYSAEFVVNHESDLKDMNPGDGLCETKLKTCTIRAAIDESNSLDGIDKILIEPNFYKITLAENNEDNNAGGDFDITESVFIVGNGISTTVISGNKLDRIFHIHPTAQFVKLSHMKLIEGFVNQEESPLASSGGAISSQAKVLYIEKVHFFDNSSYLLAGAIHAKGKLSIKKSIFEKNKSFFGGAIASNFYRIESGLFFNNRAVGNGGAIFDEYHNVLEPEILEDEIEEEENFKYSTIKNSTFKDNQIIFDVDMIENEPLLMNRIYGFGGALYLGKAKLNDNTIENNTVKFTDSTGVGAYCAVDCKINRNTFRSNNIFPDDRDLMPGSGGGLFSHGRLFLENSNFINNHARYGGAIHIVTNEGSSAILENNFIIGNTALTHGGGIFIEVDILSNVEIISNQIVDNRSSEYGGGIHAQNKPFPVGRNPLEEFLPLGIVKINTTNIENNYAGVGGGINNELIIGFDQDEFYPTMEILNSSIIRNEAESYGGGIDSNYLIGDKSNFLVLMNSTVAQNLAGLLGGGIFAYDYLLIHSSSIIGNEIIAERESVHNRGAGIYVNDANDAQLVENSFTMSRSIVYHNRTLEINGRGRFDDNCTLHHAEGLSAHFNLVGGDAIEPEGCLSDSRFADDLIGVDPQLLPIEQSPHGVFYFPINPFSPVVDHIPQFECQFGIAGRMPQVVEDNRLVDQNLLARPHGEGCDIGSVERD